MSEQLHIPNLPESLQYHWQRLQAGPFAEQPITLLHLGERQTLLICRGVGEELTMIVVPIGTAELNERYFTPRPTPASLETAIMAVEDAIAPARSPLLLASQLYCADPLAHHITLAAGFSPNRDEEAQSLSSDAVEQLFQRYCQFVEGGAPLQSGWPDATPVALLILRELMHHLAFPKLFLLPSQP
ncbi:hypothetical protein QU481_20090 [Crenobacter sp. SG2303]|uniref:Uncharacterized protein n=1 Tax=Crenobacter oryzisoli TaxID=3056844 RepID=A0ABT7XTL8_9NEIS|nr:hypothetical protein [Crenobacter sp. SG2303]MDN0077148.1 hypothetical protein [Crenobacter sp. SG2303]